MISATFLRSCDAVKGSGEDVESLQFGAVPEPVVGQQSGHHEDVHAGAVSPQVLSGSIARHGCAIADRSRIMHPLGSNRNAPIVELSRHLGVYEASLNVRLRQIDGGPAQSSRVVRSQQVDSVEALISRRHSFGFVKERVDRVVGTGGSRAAHID
jgi:hypothetical protein